MPNSILYIDDRIPDPSLGAGLPRSREIICGLSRLNHACAIYPILGAAGANGRLWSEMPEGAELLGGPSAISLSDLIRTRGGTFDIIWISRAHNIAYVNEHLRRSSGLSLREASRSVLVYDSEAVVALRDNARAIVAGKPVVGSLLAAALEREAAVYKPADCVVCASVRDRTILRDFGIKHSVVLGDMMETHETTPAFAVRHGLVLIGNLLHKGSPNHDAALWFVHHVWPLVRAHPSGPSTLTVVGPISFEIREALAGPGVDIQGRVDDLGSTLDRARLAIAPTRFAGGLPHKAYEAMSRGLPIVLTPLLAAQLGIKGASFAVAEGIQRFAVEILEVYASEARWTEVRQAGLQLVERDCSPSTFLRGLQAICDTARSSH